MRLYITPDEINWQHCDNNIQPRQMDHQPTRQIVSDVNARSRTVVTPADQMDVAAAGMLAPEANGGATDSIDADQQSSLDRRPGGM